MKIAVAAMMQETNTISHQRTALRHFVITKGDAVYHETRWKRRSIFGIIESLTQAGHTVVPGYCAIALPGALIERAAFETIVSEIVAGIQDVMPLDGICLALHGSMAAEGYDDPEGALLLAIRKSVGWQVPITCALDMHATVTDTMVRCANGYSVYRTAPHIDEYETGERAAALLMQTLASGRALVTRMVKLPILIAGEMTESDKPPFAGLLARIPEWEAHYGALDASYVLGYPWADSPHAGVAALATGFADASVTMASCAKEMADAFDVIKQEFVFTTEAYPLAEAVAIALEETQHPVVVSDSGDNPTAGAAQDMALVAEELLRQKAKNALVIAIADGDAYAACAAAGQGSTLELPLGRLAAYQAAPPTPLRIRVCVELIAHAGQMDYAVVRCEGVSIVISRERVSVAEPFDMRELGLPLERYEVISVKCGYLDPTYMAIAARSILALTPGYTCELLETMPYTRIPRPMFPLDA